ncbi:hypothetical protein SOV92_13010 [Pectobacterium brasiliense]|uniref:Lipoprotein n=1 Tax=Pectobacterium brasiliense TaxID=180957 RepID=A0AAW9HE60_9GAMM|nr:hypothetical protein [Pectobacterium brasiliense]MDY4378743.1 hypothetical protein [Pectobacterium brasiliense]
MDDIIVKRKIAFSLKVLGVIGTSCGIYSVFSPTAPDTQRNDSIVGSWLSDYSYTAKGNTVRVNGKTTFFSNGKYNFHGSISIDSYTPGDHIFIDYLSDGAGDWELYDSELITSLNSLKSKPVKLISNNEKFSPSQVERINNKKLPAIEDDMANGKNQSYKIITSEKDKMTLEVINEVGNNFKVNMQRAK